jgi:hypothetical protein
MDSLQPEFPLGQGLERFFIQFRFATGCLRDNILNIIHDRAYRLFKVFGSFLSLLRRILFSFLLYEFFGISADQLFLLHLFLICAGRIDRVTSVSST